MRAELARGAPLAAIFRDACGLEPAARIAVGHAGWDEDYATQNVESFRTYSKRTMLLSP
jgi:hypothetical protein